MDTNDDSGFGPLSKVGAEYGISRTTCYRLVAAGLLDTFKLGSRRMAMRKSFRDLPAKLKELEAQKKGGQV